MALCTHCTSIPFDDIFDPEQRPSRCTLGNVLSIARNRANCRLCDFFARACELELSVPTVDHMLDSEKITVSLHSGGRHWAQRLGIYTDSDLSSETWLRLEWESGDARKNVCITRVSSETQNAGILSPGGPRRKDGGAFLDYARIERWLASCAETHEGNCTASAQFQRRTLQLRLIDVQSCQVVKADFVSAYVALSYVWGHTDRSHCSTFWTDVDPGYETIDLPKDLPRTVTDAMIFTVSIGQRYLWVDYLCIDQNNPEALRAKIRKMHLVFECAYATVVAMEGDHANAGLSGVSKPLLQTYQPQVALGNAHLMATYMRDFHLSIGGAPWQGRAWCLQEVLLSKRIVFLDNYRATVCCQNQLYNEILPDNEDPAGSEIVTAARHLWRDGLDIGLATPSWDFTRYDALLDNYTRRALTDPSDIVNACTGALNQLTRKTGVDFVHGLPKADLDLALLWKPQSLNALVRRPGFPSWSWTGWIGLIRHHSCLRRFHETESWLADYFPEEKRLAPICSHHVTSRLAYITPLGEKVLQISSLLAPVVALHLGRETSHSRSHPRSDRDIWVLADRTGQNLPNEAGLLRKFSPAHYSFHTHTNISQSIIEAHGHCELVMIRHFAHLCDFRRMPKTKWLHDQVGCLVIVRDPANPQTATRIGMLFVPLERWLALKPVVDVVNLV